jgi:hypothetical protein
LVPPFFIFYLSWQFLFFHGHKGISSLAFPV